jgi:hypothetical protein
MSVFVNQTACASGSAFRSDWHGFIAADEISDLPMRRGLAWEHRIVVIAPSAALLASMGTCHQHYCGRLYQTTSQFSLIDHIFFLSLLADTICYLLFTTCCSMSFAACLAKAD